MKIQEIREIIKLMDQSSLDEFVFEADGTKLKLKKHAAGTAVVNQSTREVAAEPQVEAPKAVAQAPQTTQTSESQAPQAAPVAEEASTTYKTINSPMVGTFYEASSPEAEPYAKVGDKVTASTVVCIVEAMKLFNEIEAEVEGEIVEILVKDGQLVEYGQPLFSIK